MSDDVPDYWANLAAGGTALSAADLNTREETVHDLAVAHAIAAIGAPAASVLVDSASQMWQETVDTSGRLSTTAVGTAPAGTPPYASLAALTAIGARHVYVPDLVTPSSDDTTAIQALIDGTGTSSVIDFGDARHNWHVSSLTMKTGQSYLGRRAKMTHKAGSTEGILKYKDVSPPRVSVNDIFVGGIDFYGEVSVAAETERSAVFVVSGGRIILYDLRAYDFKSAAYHCQDCSDVTYDNLAAYRCSNFAGRNAIEILGVQDTQFPDTADVAHTWTIRNCKADNAGSPGGGAGGVCVIANDATNVRANIDGNWAYNCITFAGIVAEAGFARNSSITNNKAFGCKVGVYSVDTQSDHGSVPVVERLRIAGNVTDSRNVTLTSATDGSITVAAGADMPNSVGMDLQASRSSISGNQCRVTGNGILLRGNTTTGVKATSSNLSGNLVTVANKNAANTVFGIQVTNAQDVGLATNMVEREVTDVATSTATTNATTTLASVTPTTGWTNGMYVSGAGIPAGTTIVSGAGTATMIMSAAATASASGVAISGTAVVFKDAYYLDTVAALSWEGNSSRGAGRSAIRVNTNVAIATFNGGTHVDPASNESAAGIELVTNTGNTDLHFGGGLTVKDTRGTAATMTYGINAGAGAFPNSSTGEMSLMGWLTSAINGNTNMAVDQLRLHNDDKGAAPRTFGQNTQRRGRHSGVPTTAGWSSGDRLENTSSQPGVTGEWGCSSSGNPGTWRPLYVIPGINTNAADADATLTAGTDKPTQMFTAILTATRSVGLATTSNVVLEGHKFRVVRTTASTGAFNLQVGTGPLKSLATGQWCDVEYDGGNWKLTGFGSL